MSTQTNLGVALTDEMVVLWLHKDFLQKSAVRCFDDKHADFIRLIVFERTCQGDRPAPMRLCRAFQDLIDTAGAMCDNARHHGARCKLSEHNASRMDFGSRYDTTFGGAAPTLQGQGLRRKMLPEAKQPSLFMLQACRSSLVLPHALQASTIFRARSWIQNKHSRPASLHSAVGQPPDRSHSTPSRSIAAGWRHNRPRPTWTRRMQARRLTTLLSRRLPLT